MSVVFVGLGANLGDPREALESALQELDRLPHTRLVRRSSFYRSAPLGHADQPDFLNAVAQLETALPAERLLGELHAIEASHGRSRSFANAPRTLDLDLLLFGKVVLETPALTLPHPRMHERAFVLQPLVEIAPDTVIPGHGPAAALLKSCKQQQLERLGGG